MREPVKAPSAERIRLTTNGFSAGCIPPARGVQSEGALLQVASLGFAAGDYFHLASSPNAKNTGSDHGKAGVGDFPLFRFSHLLVHLLAFEPLEDA